MQGIIALKPIDELKWNIKEQQEKKVGDATNNKMVDLNPTILGFPGGAVVENLPADAGDTGSSPGLGRSHMPRSD